MQAHIHGDNAHTTTTILVRIQHTIAPIMQSRKARIVSIIWVHSTKDIK